MGNAAIAAADSPAQNNKSTAALVAAYNASGQQLLGKLAGTPNEVVSPYSVGIAMAMALAGARGETAAEMIEVLGHSLTSDEIAIANAEVRSSLQTYDGQRRPCPTWWARCSAQIARPQAKLLTANALMSGRGKLISDHYATLLRDKYGAEIFNRVSVDAVNGWVNRRTEGKVPKIVHELDPKTAAALLNAAYFKARWAEPFSKDATTDEQFNLSPSQKVQVSMMAATREYHVIARNGYRAIRLPYESAALAFVVVVPDEIAGARDLACKLDWDELARLFKDLHAHQANKLVALALPRFRASFETDLAPIFRQIGMTKPFDPGANFAGISSMNDFHIEKIVHRAVIEVAEEGTAAAAATAVVGLAPAAIAQPATPEPFRVDRPFLFYITDDVTGAVLFAGAISDPR